MSKVITGHWLLSQQFLNEMRVAARTFVFDQPRYEAFIQIQTASREGVELFTRDGSTAQILIRGVLTSEPDFFMDFFGGGNTVYGDIVAALAAADADPQIDNAILQMDTPGGETAGFLAAAQAIADFSKPITAEVTNMAASAGFGLASQADQIIAQDAMTMLGSIGVATTIFTDENEVEIASDDAPNKRPDVTTEEGRAAIRETLNAIHAEFAQVIATGRATTVTRVNSDFGRGGLVIAGDALRAGMIDAISSVSERGAPDGAASAATASMEGEPMTLQEMMIKFPELYAQIIALGVLQERDRVVAHVTAATAIGRPEMAMNFLKDGTEYGSQAVRAAYDTAHLNQKEITNALDDNDDLQGISDPKDKSAGGSGMKSSGLNSDTHVKSVFQQVRVYNDLRPSEA